jgi:hypothetical protein
MLPTGYTGLDAFLAQDPWPAMQGQYVEVSMKVTMWFRVKGFMKNRVLGVFANDRAGSTPVGQYKISRGEVYEITVTVAGGVRVPGREIERAFCFRGCCKDSDVKIAPSWFRNPAPHFPNSNISASTAKQDFQVLATSLICKLEGNRGLR